MSSTTAQLTHSTNMALYEPPQQFSMWKHIASSSIAASSILKEESCLQRESQNVSDQPTGQSDNDDQSSRLQVKMKRRLAQNREAARKSRLRKKAYVQQLESSRMKLAQVEQELQHAKHQNIIVGSASNGNLRAINTAGIATFEMEYSKWMEEKYKKTMELRVALEANASEIELKIVVEGLVTHYCSLFRMKANAAKADVFYLISGIWRTPVERFFLWIGGFRPSELLNVVMPHLEVLSEEQQSEIKKLEHSLQQAEYSLTQGMDRLQQLLGQIVVADEMSESLVEKLHAIEGFVCQADNVREQALMLMYQILTTHQAARGLLALGDYFHRLSVLGSLWTTRPNESM